MSSLVVCAVSISGVIAVLYATGPWGAAVNWDAVAYLKGASGILEGRGYVIPTSESSGEPITHWPPGLSAAIALAASVEHTNMIRSAARHLQALLYLLNTALFAVLAVQLTRDRWVVVLGVFLFAWSQDVALVHAMVWSEPLFLTCQFLLFLQLARVVDMDDVYRLVVAALLVGAATLIRYAGVSLVPTGAAAILWFGSGRLRSRIRQATLLTILGGMPLALWLLRNYLLTGYADRIDGGAISLHHLRALASTIAGWAIPSPLPRVIRFPLIAVVGLAALTCATLVYVRRPPARAGAPSAPPASALPQVLRCFILVYPAFLMVSIAVKDYATMPDGRILLPLYAGILLLSLPILSRIRLDLSESHSATTMWTARLAIVTLVVGRLAGLAVWARDAHRHGVGFEGAPWATSPLIQAASALPSSTRVYTNMWPPVALFSGADALAIGSFSSCSRLQTVLTDHPLRSRDEVAYVLRFDDASGRLGSDSEACLQPLVRAKNGVLYRVVP